MPWPPCRVDVHMGCVHAFLPCIAAIQRAMDWAGASGSASSAASSPQAMVTHGNSSHSVSHGSGQSHSPVHGFMQHHGMAWKHPPILAQIMGQSMPQHLNSAPGPGVLQHPDILSLRSGGARTGL